MFRSDEAIALTNDAIIIGFFKGAPHPDTVDHLSFNLDNNMRALREALETLKKNVVVEDPGDEIGLTGPDSPHMGLWFHDPDGYRWEQFRTVPASADRASPMWRLRPMTKQSAGINPSVAPNGTGRMECLAATAGGSIHPVGTRPSTFMRATIVIASFEPDEYWFYNSKSQAAEDGPHLAPQLAHPPRQPLQDLPAVCPTIGSHSSTRSAEIAVRSARA